MLTWNENLKMFRERYGYSQHDLSNILGTSERTLQRYESGESEPTASILLKLSKIYETSIDNLLGNEIDTSFNLAKIERCLKDIENSCHKLRNEMYESENNNLL